MSRTYKAVGINLKSMPLGESDRLLTILTQELGLIRAVASGARKHNSKLGGRTGLFVVNQLLLAKGRSLDKITQAETIESYPGLSQDLGKLAASQYLAEMILAQALSEQPQAELFSLLNEHLSRLERLPNNSATLLLAHLSHAVFHLLALAGMTPQVQVCCVTQRPLKPDFTDPDWRVGFSVPTGGTVSLAALERLQAEGRNMPPQSPRSSILKPRPANYVVSSSGALSESKSAFKAGGVAEAAEKSYQTVVHRQEIPLLNTRLKATELALLQQLAEAALPQLNATLPDQQFSLDTTWISVEQVLRQYAQYHFGRPIRSAALIDSYFASLPTSAIN